jgi:hypothetical protein
VPQPDTKSVSEVGRNPNLNRLRAAGLPLNRRYLALVASGSSCAALSR